MALSADSTRIARESVNKYLLATGKEGQFYKEALALLREAEKAEIRVEETGNEMSADFAEGSTMGLSKLKGRVTDCRKARIVGWS